MERKGTSAGTSTFEAEEAVNSAVISLPGSSPVELVKSEQY